MTNEIEPTKTNTGKPLNGRNPFSVRGVGRIGSDVAEERKPEPAMKPKTESDKLADAMQKTASADHKAEVPNALQKAVRAARVAKENPRDKHDYKGPRITDAERDQFYRVNLKEYIETHGGGIRGKNPHDGAKISGGREYQMEHPTFGKLVVTQFSSGKWGYLEIGATGREDHLKNTIVNFVAKTEKLSGIEACHKLRHEFGTTPSEIDVAKERMRAKAGDFSKPEETFVQRMERVLVEPVRKAKDWVKTNWEAGIKGLPGYGLSRGLTRETLMYFSNDIRLEGQKSRDGMNNGGIMIAIRDNNGELTGFTRKGYQIDPETGTTMRRTAGGSVRFLNRMGELNDPKLFMPCEAPLDAMSLYQLRGAPEKTQILGTGGRMTELQQAQIYELAKKNPGAEWLYPMQNDEIDPKTGKKPSDEHLAMTKEAVLAADPTAKFQVAVPPQNVKDWNDVVKAEHEAAKAARPPQEPTESRQTRRELETQIREQRERQETARKEREDQNKGKDGLSR